MYILFINYIMSNTRIIWKQEVEEAISSKSINSDSETNKSEEVEKIKE